MTIWRVLLLIVGGAIVLFAIAAVGLGYWMSTPAYRGPISDHFDGRRFRNQEPTSHSEFLDVARWMWTREPGPWGDRVIPPPKAPPLQRVDIGRLRVTWVGHSTTLIQMDGLNILTDPNWSERASPVQWAGPRRFVAPGVAFEHLPPIDVVLLSHNHYDHLDIGTLRRLSRDHKPRIVVPLGVAAFLKRKGIAGAEEMDWWADSAVGGAVRLTAVPAKHFSGRGFFDRDRNLWASYLIAGPAGNVYFAGDTGFGPHFAQVRERFGAIRLAILPIGAYEPRWFMSRVHVSPDEAFRAHEILGAATSLAIHWGTFQLADDAQEEAPAKLRALVARAPADRQRFWLLEFGEGRDVP
jgi:L-ascorbate metabolism protein UlaG (beta-lactamase superfamily)